ncbi:MAG: PAS domain-containing protein [Spirochaetes bacterium]|nr:PAS domain-containing protein [Spirochaetota bacterium]
MKNQRVKDESTSFFNMILRHLPDAVIVIDTGGRVLAWNDAMERLTGIARADIIGKSGHEYSIPLYGERRPILVDLINSENPEISQTYDKFVSSNSTIYAEGYTPQAYGGRGAYLSGTASPLFDEKGNWIGAIETIRDITEIRKIERELKESEHHYRTLVESIQFGITLIDRDYNLVWTNPAQARMFNKQPGMQYKVKCFQEHEKRDSVCPHCPGKQAMETGLVHSVQTTGIRDDGSSFNAQVTAFPHYSSDGTIIGFIEIVEDITEMVKANILLKESLKEKETLLKEVHHRVKNNLQVIVSLLTLQSQKTEDPHLIQQFIIAENRIKSMAAIHEILYRTENFTSINFAEYIKTISYQLLNVYGNENIKPSLIFNLDPVYLGITQAVPCGLIVNEILTNSFKYAFPPEWSGDPKIEISMRIEDDNTVDLVLSDNGIGTPDKNQPETNETLGLTLIEILTKQINGRFSYDGSDGTRITIRFKKN